MINKELEYKINKWIKNQHGTAGWEMKLKNFILNLIYEGIQEERERYPNPSYSQDEVEKIKVMLLQDFVVSVNQLASDSYVLRVKRR